MAVSKSPHDRRRAAFAALAIVFFLILSCVMYCAGKSHSVFVDNSDAVLADGRVVKALDGALVTFDNGEELDTYSGMRDEFAALRQRHHLSVEYEGEVVERSFRIPATWNALVLRIPVFFRYPDEQSLWLEPFGQTAAADSSSADFPFADDGFGADAGLGEF